MNEVWGTNELALATFLVLCGHELRGFHWFCDTTAEDQRTREGTCFCLFDDTWAVRHCASVYANGEAEVNAAHFALWFGRIKRRMVRSNRRPSPLLLAAS